MRRASWKATADLVEELLTPGQPIGPAICERGLPLGARLVAAHVNHRRELVLTFEHESFDDVADGEEPPVAFPPPAFRKLAAQEVPCVP